MAFLYYIVFFPYFQYTNSKISSLIIKYKRPKLSKFIIQGKKQLNGIVQISGAKNAALKMMAATILTNKTCQIHNVPKILDIKVMAQILESIGAKITWTNKNTLLIDPSKINSFRPNPDLVGKLRASVVLAGPLLARFKKAVIAQPGGCIIGARPVYIHWKAFEKMGVKVEIKNNLVFLNAPENITNQTVVLDQLSVTGTENILMFAAGIDAKINIHMAAAEPEIQNLANLLKKMGAKIKGAGTHEIKILGKSTLSGAKINVIPDRIEAGTFIIAGVITRGNVLIKKIIPDHMEMFFNKLETAGANFKIINKIGQFADIKIMSYKQLHPIKIDTRTYPGFPTDLQAPISILLTQCPKTSKIFESLYENRLQYLGELKKMGAKINVLDTHTAEISGPTNLHGAEITSFDLRAGATLILAGLIADKTTEIDNIETIDRGYENIEKKLQNLGANIIRK